MRRAGASAALALAALALAAPRADAKPPTGPPIVKVNDGAGLFAANCARCHGIDGNGGHFGPNLQGPSLRGVGALAADFYLRTGYMPLDSAADQPERSSPKFSDPQIEALVRYVASLGSGPAVPKPGGGDISEGRELFTEHCSGCHQVVAEGGVMPGAKAPPLHNATPTQIAEAVRIGPYVMPKFTKKDLSDAQLNSIITYVESVKTPDDAGGWGIGHLGPFSEGIITWLIAIPLLLITCLAIGKRVRT
jgi:ubiquinol-cytochrome c reductase cytochrome c subunit